MTAYAIVESDVFDPLERDEELVRIPELNDWNLAHCIASALVEAAGLDSDKWYRVVQLPYVLKRKTETR